MVALILLKLFAASLTVAAKPIEIRFEGFRSEKGFLAISIFSEEQKAGFPGDQSKAFRKYYRNLLEQDAGVIRDDLPEGTYAISALHDENGDTKLETNFLGIPQEGFGFSMNPRILMGSPAFERAKFHTEDTQKIEIRIKYF